MPATWLMGDLQTEADRRLMAVLAQLGARDPRDFCRDQLRDLKRIDRGAYEEAAAYYRDTLVPSVANGADPLPAWTEYGRRLAALWAPGRAMMVDRLGIAAPYESPAPHDQLVLHLPDSSRKRPVVVGAPADLSRAQRATFNLLVRGRLSLEN